MFLKTCNTDFHEVIITFTDQNGRTLEIEDKKVVHKAGEFVGNKTADSLTNSYHYKIMKTKPVEEIINPPNKRGNIEQIKASIVKMEQYEISKVLNDSSASKLSTKHSIEVNDLPSGQYFVNKIVRFKNSMLRSDLHDILL